MNYLLGLILAFSFLSSPITFASTDMCLKKMRDLKLRRSVEYKKGKSRSSSGVTTNYVVNDDMIISSYSDPKTGKRRVIAHKKSGGIDIGGDGLGCEVDRSKDIYSIIAEIIEHEMSSDFYKLGRGNGSSKPASEKDTRDLIKRCRDIKSDKVQVALDNLEKLKGYGYIDSSKRRENSAGGNQ